MILGRRHDNRIDSGVMLPPRHDDTHRVGGSGEIRTHERVSPSPVFKTGAFNRSATLPKESAHCKRLN